MCETAKKWPSDKVKENCETNLKVHCVMQLQLLVSFKVFRWLPLNLHISKIFLTECSIGVYCACDVYPHCHLNLFPVMRSCIFAQK